MVATERITILDETPNIFAPQGLTYEERRRIEADIADKRGALRRAETECACAVGAWRANCEVQAAWLRQDIAALAARLGEEA